MVEGAQGHILQRPSCLSSCGHGLKNQLPNTLTELRPLCTLYLTIFIYAKTTRPEELHNTHYMPDVVC